MAKKTLLQMVQDILNDMDSDEVNSINDTVESAQVAQIVRSSYEEMVSNRNWPQHRKIIQLESTNDPLRPNYLVLPDNIHQLEIFRYNVHKNEHPEDVVYKDIIYREPDSFLRSTAARDINSPHVRTVTDYSGVKYLVTNNKAPSYWTSFDDTYLVTDSYDASVDDTLMKSKSQALAYMDPVWQHVDTFIPDLPSDAFSALIEEAKSTAFNALKQMANQKAEQKANRQQRWLSRKAWKAKGGVVYPNYGRRGRI